MSYLIKLDMKYEKSFKKKYFFSNISQSKLKYNEKGIMYTILES